MPNAVHRSVTQEQAGLVVWHSHRVCDMQRDAIGDTVKLDEHGFPDVSALHLGDMDQDVLRYEGLQAMYREKQQEAEQQQQQSSSNARTPFADARPQLDDRYSCCHLACENSSCRVATKVLLAQERLLPAINHDLIGLVQMFHHPCSCKTS